MPDAIDWAQVRRTLEVAQAATEAGGTMGRHREEEILTERACAMAKIGSVEEAGGESIDVLEFEMGGERYAVETAYVVEVLPLMELTPLPGGPEFILGSVIVRGRVLCLNDLSRFFGLPPRRLSERDKIVVLRKGEMEIAVLAEAILGTRAIAREDIRALAAAGQTGRSFLKGVTTDGTSVMDAAVILEDPRLVVNQVDGGCPEGTVEEMR